MVGRPPASHEVLVQGVSLTGQAQPAPALLQMNDDDFPARFMTDLSTKSVTAGSTVTPLVTSPATPVTLYQPVQRLLNVALLQLACQSVTFPRLDPTRVDSAGLVIRRVPRAADGTDQLNDPLEAWLRTPDGQFSWTSRSALDDCLDPDPARRAVVPSGQPALDELLAAQALMSAKTETFTPAFVAPPAVCNAACATLVYGLIPTASSEISTTPPTAPVYDPQQIINLLPPSLKALPNPAFLPGKAIDYHWMSDDYANANATGSDLNGVLNFTLTLRLLSTVIGAFGSSADAQALMATLNKYYVYVDLNGVATVVPMGSFYQQAAQYLVDYDPFSGDTAQSVTLPWQWDTISASDANAIRASVTALLQSRSALVTAPMGRFQDASRLYRVRIFLRIKGHTPRCPPKLVWSRYTDPFRIAAWHESGGRLTAPIPLPDPTDKTFRANARPNCHFAVPSGLMNMMQGTTLSGLTKGVGASSGGIQLDWICGFNIPLITICACLLYTSPSPRD